MSMIKHARTRAVTQVCHPTDKPEDVFLIQLIEIVCEQCESQIQYHIPGHHIPVMLRILQKAMDQHPDLCKETVMEAPQGSTIVVPPNPRVQ